MDVKAKCRIAFQKVTMERWRCLHLRSLSQWKKVYKSGCNKENTPLPVTVRGWKTSRAQRTFNFSRTTMGIKIRLFALSLALCWLHRRCGRLELISVTFFCFNTALISRTVLQHQHRKCLASLFRFLLIQRHKQKLERNVSRILQSKRSVNFKDGAY